MGKGMSMRERGNEGDIMEGREGRKDIEGRSERAMTGRERRDDKNEAMNGGKERTADRMSMIEGANGGMKGGKVNNSRSRAPYSPREWQWLTFPFPFVHSPSFSEHIFVEDRIKDYQPVETRTQDGWPRQRYEMKKMAMERVYERERERESLRSQFNYIIPFPIYPRFPKYK